MSRELYEEIRSEYEIDNHDLAFLLYETLQQISQITKEDEVKIRINLADWYLRKIVGETDFSTIKERYKDIGEIYKLSN